MTRRVLLLLALTCAIGVGNLYFPQAITPLISAAMGASPQDAALVVTATQVGYTLGIIFLVPLGDRFPYRRLIVVLLLLTAAGLLAAACASTLSHLVAMSVVIGASTVAAQLIAPLAAELVDDRSRGTVMGALLSGSIIGMLLARTAGAALAEHLGWRAPYIAAAIVVAILAVALRATLPVTTPTDSPRSYSGLLRGPLELLWSEPSLRRSCLYQACVFAGFSAVWTCIALLLTGPTYGLDATVAGAVALVGALAAFCTPLAGRMTDRRGPDSVNSLCFVGVLGATAVLLLGGCGGPHGFVALVAGVLGLDSAMQSGMVANQARIFAIRADMYSQLNTAYMACSYSGGAVGSWFGVFAFRVGEWPGVCILVAALTSVAYGRHLVRRRATKQSVRRAGSASC